MIKFHTGGIQNILLEWLLVHYSALWFFPLTVLQFVLCCSDPDPLASSKHCTSVCQEVDPVDPSKA